METLNAPLSTLENFVGSESSPVNPVSVSEKASSLASSETTSVGRWQRGPDSHENNNNSGMNKHYFAIYTIILQVLLSYMVYIKKQHLYKT